jgi:hypothetical protein
MARKFLYIVAFCIVLVIAGGLALSFWARELTEIAMVPRAEFVKQAPLADNAYADPHNWISRPGMGRSNPAQWLPDDFTETAPPSTTAVFFVHPTSFFEASAWNAPLDHAASRARAELFVRGMASPFNRSVNLWVPRYRQAAIGAFLAEGPEAAGALDIAYGDVANAFEFFLTTIGPDTPIVLAGHSQGALHLRRLLKERIAGTGLADRIAAAYVVGWPLSIANDLPEMGLPACATPAQPGCIMSWSSYAEPADPSQILEAYEASIGLNGQHNAGAEILCSNPLTGGIGGSAPAEANLGTLVPNETFTNGRLVPDAVPARCDPPGILLIGSPPELGNAVLPGNNYHVYDIPLFWANLRADVAARTAAWREARARAGGE